MLYSQGCVPIIAHPTRITETSSTIINHIYSNNISKTIKNFILIHDLTDHLPILVSTKSKFYEQDSATIPIRDTTQFDAERFTEKFWTNLDNLNEDYLHNINQYRYMIDFINIFCNTLNKSAPLRKQTRKEKKLKTKLWITTDILKSIQHKNNIYNVLNNKMLNCGRVTSNTETQLRI